MSGVNSEVKVLIPRNKKKRQSGFEVEESDDGRYYFSKIPSDCRQVSLGDQVREINGTRWLDIEDEEHANELLNDPGVETISLSVIPNKGSRHAVDDDDDDDDDDEDYEEEEDVRNDDTDEDDEHSMVSGSSDSEDVSIDTDPDEDTGMRRKSASSRPSQARKSIKQQQPSTTSDVHVSDASDEDDEDVEDYNYAQQTAKRGDDRPQRQSTTSRNDTTNSSSSNSNNNKRESTSSVKPKARDVGGGGDRNVAPMMTRDSHEEKPDKAKEAERERAKAIKQRREQEKQDAAAERKRKDELAEQLKDAEAHGKKIQRAKVVVERNIGAYSLGGSPNNNNKSSSSSPKKPTSNSGGGWNKVAAAPKPSSSGWNKVSISNKK